MFKINFGDSSGAFGVPNDIVDEHLKLAGALSLKVLLVLLRVGKPMALSDLAQFLNQSEENVQDSINYWVQLNVIRDLGNTSPIVKAEAKTEPVMTATPPVEVADSAEPKKLILKERFYRMTRHDVNELSQRDSNVGVLIGESQNILARPLSSGESETIVSFYNHYGLKVDVILMLLHYCKSIGKDSPAFYEKMAIEWVNKEIDTHEKAEQELVRLTQVAGMENTLRKMFGIYDRKLTKKEVEFYNMWKSDYGMDDTMITLAYDRTIDIKGKLSFHYINAILKSWSDKNIKTPREAENDSENRNNKNRGNSNQASEKPSESSYNLDELDKIITSGNVWD